MPIRRLLTLVAAFLVLVATSRIFRSSHHDPHEKRIKPADPKKYRREPFLQEPVNRPTPPYQPDNRPGADDERQQRYERRYWAVTGVASVAATIATVIAAGFAIGAYNASWQAVRAARDQTYVAKAALIASNRAWLDLKVEIISDLRPEIDGENIAVRVSARNFGHSPALGAYLAMEFHANRLFEGAPGAALKKACDYGNTAALASLAKAGRVVVPGAPLVWDRSDTASESNIDDALRSINGKSEGKRTTNLPVMSVLICVTYMTPEDTEMHQTAITRDVFRKSTNSETGMRFLARGSLIPRSDLVLSDFMPGDYAD